MSDDIVALIERARREQRFYGGTLLGELADALSRLTTSPLPQEIAGLIKRANDGSINTDRAEDRKLFADLGDALRVQAQEKYRLNQDLNFQYARCADKDAEIARLGNLVETDLNEDDR